MARIDKFIANPGSVFNDNSVTINAQQNNTQFNSETQLCCQQEEQPDKQTPPAKISLNPRKGTRIDLFRVIIALQKSGFFLDKTGCKATQKDVFAAFGSMLGEDFSKFQKNLSEASKHNNDSPVSTEIFDILKAAFEAYEEQ